MSDHYDHYKYLERVLPAFLEATGIKWEHNQGIIVAHGDKFYGYRERIEEAGMTFGQGIAIGMLTYCHPYSAESRETEDGWVAPIDWIVNNKSRFLHLLPSE